MAAKLPGKIGGKALSDALRKLAEEAITITDDGTPVTRAQQLAQEVWKLALGYFSKEKTMKDGVATVTDVWHPPVPWAMQWITERLEGKAPVAVQEEQVGLRAADKVRALAVDRINKLAGARKGPPSLKGV